METSELQAVSQEIKQIKEEAFDAGYQAAKQEYNKARSDIEKAQKELREESEKVALLRTEWQTMIKMVQQHYLMTHDQTLKLKNEHSIFMSYSNEPKLTVPADMDEFQEELAKMVQMGRDFDILLKGIREHAVLKGTWDKLLMTFKMIQP